MSVQTSRQRPGGNAAAAPDLGEAAREWARIGVLSFGGPAGQIALMHRIVVDEKRWISETRFLHALNYCMLLPGPEAMQLATYIGWLLHGTRGGIIAGTLFVLPGFLVIAALSTLYALFQRTGWLDGLFFGLKAAILAIVIEALIRIGRRALGSGTAILIAVAAFVAISALGVAFPLIVAAAALTGFLAARFGPPEAGAGAGTQAYEASGAFEDAPPSLPRAIRLIAVWGGLWIAPFLLSGALWGFGSVFAAIMAFFSKMAVVTFGGAYAVLAYVARQAVETLGWLRPGEMLDGLALAETTPGPLVLVLTYVGFLAGFREAAGLPPLAAGLLGAALATWATFVPCFLWIFLGAPHIERLRGNTVLGGALRAITAAAAGVIVNLAVWLALHFLFGEVGAASLGPFTLAWPEWSSLQWPALGLSATAFAALFILRLGVLPTLGICAAGGLAIRML